MTESADLALRAAGLRRTPARLRVLAVIQDLDQPRTHAELLDDPRLSGLDDITLYRTLTALEGAGLAHRVLGLDGTWRTCRQPVEQPGCPGNHAHFLCTRCGRMTCLTQQPMPRVAVPDGAIVEGRHFLVHGTCPSCAADASPSPRPGDDA